MCSVNQQLPANICKDQCGYLSWVPINKTVWCKRYAPTCLSSVKTDEKSAPRVRWQKMHYTHQMNCNDLIFLAVPLKRWYNWFFAVFTFLETEKTGKSFFCDPEYRILGHHQSKSAFLMFFFVKKIPGVVRVHHRPIMLDRIMKFYMITIIIFKTL